MAHFVKQSLPGLVLVHGGEHAGDCWDLTVDELARQAPELAVLAVDLPRPDVAGPATTIAGWVASTIAQIEDARLEDIVIVGHSLAGLTVPGVVAKLGSPRVREMVLAACSVPAQGSSVADTLAGPLAWYVRRAARLRKPPGTTPDTLARWLYCNGMTVQQREFTLTRRCAESVTVITKRADRRDLPADVPRTWILTLRDRSLSVRAQRRSMDALGGVETVIPIDTCHDLMVSEPKLLAEILIQRCRTRS